MLGLEIPLWLLLAVLTACLLYWHGTSTYNTFTKLGIPHQAASIPFLGTVFEGFARSLPADDLYLMKQFPGKVCGRFIGRRPVLYIADAAMFKEIMVNQASKFRNRQSPLDGEDNPYTRNIVTTADDHWKHVRSILVPTFTSGKLKLMFPMIRNCADKLAKHLKATQTAPFIIKEHTASYTMDVIASTAFGMDIDAHAGHPFVTHASKMLGTYKYTKFKDKLHQFFVFFIIFIFPRYVRVFLSRYFDIGFCGMNKDSLRYITNIIDMALAQRQSHGTSSERLQGKDFLSICCEKVVDMKDVKKADIRKDNVTGFTWTTAGLTKEDFIANAVVFILAGFDTTGTTLQFLLYAMALYPDIQEQLYEEIEANVKDKDVTYEDIQQMKYLSWCVYESLRVYPPGIRFDRIANEEATVNGFVIPKGMVVYGLLYGMNHDPDLWPNPDKFDPTRFSEENLTEAQKSFHYPFGSGGRSCIAMRLALIEVKVAVVQLLKTFRFETCAETTPPESLEFVKFNNFLQTVAPLKISAVVR